jgi:hypothetical protein
MRLFLRHLAAVLALLALVGLVTGCSTTKRRGGASLSDAAGEASKPREEQEKLELGREVEDDEEGEDLATTLLVTAMLADDASGNAADAPPPLSAQEPSLSTVEKWRRERGSATVSWLYGELAGDALARYRGLAISGQIFPMSQLRAGGGFYVLSLDPDTSPAVNSGLRDFGEIGLEASARYYLTRDYTFMGLYLLGGLRVGLLSWDYRTPITIVDGEEQETIDSDRVTTWGLYTGIGLAPIQLRHLHIGANVVAGLRVHGGTTREGFANDLLGDVGYLQLRFESSYFF